MARRTDIIEALVGHLGTNTDVHANKCIVLISICTTSMIFQLLLSSRTEKIETILGQVKCTAF